MSTKTTGFNIDDRLAKRDAEGVTLGGETFRRARLNNRQLRELRRLGRDGARLTRHEQALTLELNHLTAQDPLDEEKVTEVEGKLDGLQDEQMRNTYELLQLQLGGPEHGPALDLLEEQLDMRDADALAEFLADEKPEDKTDPTTPTATTLVTNGLE